ncbi:MAG: hypothetical protein KJP08_01150 [Gammaproteobacteria bacterium]|nr:hypothetical protein [Gammaproteobacteria bacterium]MBT8093390.1 hypothetical protein [Gammaproteobacteria bacterium]
MSSFESIVSHQVETLTGVLREHTEKRRGEILRKAHERADAILRHSRRAARARVHEAVTEERRRRESALLEARQRLDTDARRQVQRRYLHLLDQAWPGLNRELAARWAEPEARAEWCELLLEEAGHTLGGDGWIVEHPHPETGAWSRDDERRLEIALAARNLPTVEFRADAGFDAGLRIRRGGACLDGTIAGLLARRTAVEGRLIAHWEAAGG